VNFITTINIKPKRHKARTNPTICMINCYYCPFTTPIPTSSSRSNHNTTNRSYPKYIIFQPSRRWRSNPIPTPVLILWAPRSLYSHSTRIHHRQLCVIPV
jgi:hypothetical protein